MNDCFAEVLIANKPSRPTLFWFWPRELLKCKLGTRLIISDHKMIVIFLIKKKILNHDLEITTLRANTALSVQEYNKE